MGGTARLSGPSWLRGTTRLDGDDVVLASADAVAYAPSAERTVAWEFVQIDGTADVLAFASRYGLLRAPHGREPLQLWFDEVTVARGTLELHYELEQAAIGAASMAAFRESWAGAAPGEPIPRSDDDLLAEARQHVAWSLSRGLAGCTLDVGYRRFGQAPGYELVREAPTLLGYVYLQLADAIVGRTRLRRCVECGALFPVHDARQRFCSERHAGRARFRRFQERRAAAVTAHGARR